MQEIKTVNLKVNSLPKEEYIALMEQARLMYNDFTSWAYTNGTYNKVKCHHATYKVFTEKYKLVKTGLQQAIRDMAMEACKRNKLKGKPSIKKSLTVRLNALCFTLRGKQLTLIGSAKRHKEILHVPEYYKEIYENWT